MVEGILKSGMLYRLPWSISDNPISWLEPTSACNLACEGCYRKNEPDSHKPLEMIRQEVKTFIRLRNSDTISVAGGEPLMHPRIIEIVEMISDMGIKPILNTNGALLTNKLLLELKRAGAVGFTFHIDSTQGRPQWRDKNEVELNELRLYYARMLKHVGGLSCGFNSTIHEGTLQYVGRLTEWAADNLDIVNLMVFILYRGVTPEHHFRWYAGDREIDANQLHYVGGAHKTDLKSTEVLTEIRRNTTDFTPCAFLNGTEKPDSAKWLLTGRIGLKGRIFGYVGPRFMEAVQMTSHLLRGRYLAYSRPNLLGMGRSMLLLSTMDSGTRSIAKYYLKVLFSNPLMLFKKLLFQSVMIIQPVDFLDDGAQNMCDGCPDMTLWNGKLVWSCRLEELKQFGCWVKSIPKKISQ